ncbi:MAG: hypothetical protein ACYTEQ_13740 [Planctomycetota bacterium]|jgi:hypothetical protein
MKDSKEYSRKIRKLYTALKRKYSRPQKAAYEDPVEALVFAVVAEKMSDAAAQAAVKRFGDCFVDLNDLRVSRPEEIIEVLRGDAPLAKSIASTLTGALNAVFNKYNTVSLRALKKIGKKQAKQTLQKAISASPFVIDYCMLTSLQGHAIPLTETMTDYLRSSELVHPDADEQQIEGFLAKQISSENGYEFYWLLRRQSESRRVSRKRKTTRKTKVKAATEKQPRKTTRTRKRKK